MEVGDLRRGTKSLPVKKPQFSEAFPEATIREGADELTLRADEVGAQLRSFITTEHVEFEWCGPPLVDADWHAFLPSNLQRYWRERMGRAAFVTAEK